MSTLHLYRRNGVYYWQRRIPAGLRHLFSKTAVRFSIRTDVFLTARHRSALLRIETDRFFDELKTKMESGIHLHCPDQDERLRDLLAWTLYQEEAKRAARPMRCHDEADQAATKFQIQQQTLQRSLALNNYDEVVPSLQTYLDRWDFKPNPESEEHRLMLRQATIIMLRAAKINEQRERGNYDSVSEPVHYPIVALPTFSAPQKPLIAKPTARISEAYDALRELKIKSNPTWGKNTGRHHEASRRLLIESIGDKPLAEVTHDEMQDFKELLLRLPNNHGKSKKRRPEIYEAIAVADQKDENELEKINCRLDGGEIDVKMSDMLKDTHLVERLDPNTVNKHIDRAAGAFELARRKKQISGDSPVDGVRLSKKEVARLKQARKGVERLPWEAERIQALMQTSVFTVESLKSGNPSVWAPLIALHSGMRMEECLQLHPGDIEKYRGVWCFQVRNGPGQSIKTMSSKRPIPVHQKLIEWGLLELAAERQAQGEDWLFPMLDKGKCDGRFSGIFSKRFHHYRRRNYLYDPRYDFHSFRKNFNVALREAGVQLASRKRLLGHEIYELADSVYDNEGESMPERKAMVDLIDFGIEIS